jgi:hypothetical protein
MSGRLSAASRAVDGVDFINIAAPFDLMKFTLTYSGSLESSGNKPKLSEVWAIRNALHPQLSELWQTHPVLIGLGFHASATVSKPPDVSGGKPPSRVMPREILPNVQVSLESNSSSARVRDILNTSIARGGFSFTPIARKSLSLICALDILFMRKEEPGSLVLQGGDIDGRLKTLFDALKVPSEEEIKNHTPIENPLYCVMEQDALITGVNVRTDRLLTVPNGDVHQVHLIIEVTIRVMRVSWDNLGFLGE